MVVPPRGGDEISRVKVQDLVFSAKQMLERRDKLIKNNFICSPFKFFYRLLGLVER